MINQILILCPPIYDKKELFQQMNAAQCHFVFFESFYVSFIIFLQNWGNSNTVYSC